MLFNFLLCVYSIYESDRERGGEEEERETKIKKGKRQFLWVWGFCKIIMVTSKSMP